MAKILIVDDYPEVRKNIKKSLENENHMVFEAENGDSCIKFLKNNEIDLIILDIFMPEKGGIDTLMEIKSLPIKKIMITGGALSESDAVHKLIMHLGAEKILYKPFKNELLIDSINSALAKK